MNIKMQLQKALLAQPYQCRSTIRVLKNITKVNEAFGLLNSKKRSYTLEEHTIMVCELFESFFANKYNCQEFNINCFRLLLCLHDIGKPFSLQYDDKEHQWNYTVQLITDNANSLPLSNKELSIVIAILSDDPLGLYIRSKIEYEEALARLSVMINKSTLSISKFMKLLIIYYQVDSGAYTRQAYIGPIEEFIEKPKLEAIFEKDDKGSFVYICDENRLLFTPNTEAKLHKIKKGLGVVNG